MLMGAILKKMAVFFKENAFCVGLFCQVGAILKKRAISFKENASRSVELWLGGTHHAHLSV